MSIKDLKPEEPEGPALTLDDIEEQLKVDDWQEVEPGETEDTDEHDLGVQT